METPAQKKFKQAALPFKPITPKEDRTGKRRLSFNNEGRTENSLELSKEPKKAKIVQETVTIDLTDIENDALPVDDKATKIKNSHLQITSVVSNYVPEETHLPPSVGTVSPVPSSVTEREVDTVSLDSSNVAATNAADLSLANSSELDISVTANGGTKSTRRSDRKRKLSTSATDSQKTESTKRLTPKQLKLQEERKLAREAREKQLLELKQQKQLEKEQRELERRQDREEKEEVRRREREEKEDARRKEREEKEEARRKERAEKERLLEEKNEEKRKRLEAKENEQRKKEELQKRSAAILNKFLLPKQTKDNDVGGQRISSTAASAEATGTDPSGKNLFLPFEVKPAMTMAPVNRNVLDSDARSVLDGTCGQCLPKTALYLAELRANKIIPQRWVRPPPSSKREEEEGDDVQVIEDDLEVAGEVITEDVKPEQHMRAKFFKFVENRRPPYRGTWRKKTKVITGKRPFAKDKQFFDYEVESDLEWEEDEPGEVLGDSDEDKEKESDDDDYEVDNAWLVPHGHLSDEELHCGDESDNDDANTREAQQVKLKLLQQEFALEIQKPTKKLQPRLIGVIFADEAGNKPANISTIIWDVLHKRKILRSGPIKVIEPKPIEESMTTSASPAVNSSENKQIDDKLQPLQLTKSLLAQLIRLLHLNGNSKDFLINEFLAYLSEHSEEIKESKAALPTKISLRKQIEEFATWQVVEVASNAKVQRSATKRPKKRIGWYVAEDVLKEYGLHDLPAINNWCYILEPKVIHATGIIENSIEEQQPASSNDPGGATPKTQTGRALKKQRPPKNNALIKEYLQVKPQKGEAATSGISALAKNGDDDNAEGENNDDVITLE